MKSRVDQFCYLNTQHIFIIFKLLSNRIALFSKLIYNRLSNAAKQYGVPQALPQGMRSGHRGNQSDEWRRQGNLNREQPPQLNR
jgi:hypothetical protein